MKLKDQVAQAGQMIADMQRDITLRDICLTALIRDEFAWTEKFTAKNGAWFQMGIYAATGPSGGIVLIQEYYPSNLKPSQYPHWAEPLVEEMGQHMLHRPSDEEGLVYRECFYALRELYWKKVREAGHVDDAAAPS